MPIFDSFKKWLGTTESVRVICEEFRASLIAEDSTWLNHLLGTRFCLLGFHFEVFWDVVGPPGANLGPFEENVETKNVFPANVPSVLGSCSIPAPQQLIK